ncbi:hypothetical protein PSI22_20600 [Xenorhabdus sp. XENO-7]|uniref:Phage protein n=1 Tax=Xenorhabdus aichiensis TaxID=3025874 RepID=A0ABT5M8G0_9GAMM|nr:hypothetical protein [Xenorhabdus aichiensis]MDC9623969.1 hypothetical protein [Xenorhabdus aichiensis]
MHHIDLKKYPKLKIGDRVVLKNGDKGYVDIILNSGGYDCMMDRTNKYHMLPPSGQYITIVGYDSWCRRCRDAGTELPYETDDSFSIDWNSTVKLNTGE